jgi:cyclopropane fatty-acyl-phospholipid synthase-like methyltransferase
MKTLPQDREMRFLDVGCYPGRYLWYFHHYFGYQISGLEYVDWCCEHTRQCLQGHGLEGEIIHGDLLTYQPPSIDAQWDIVASLGLVEHFTDTVEVIRKHLDLLKPGGYLVLVIPNHQGLYGRILKLISPEKYRIHNRMSYEDMRGALKQLGRVEILAGGYYGHLGFWNTGLYARVKPMGTLPYLMLRAPLWTLEQAGQLLPNTAHLSPNAALVARKWE